MFSQNTIMKITVKDLGTIITGTTPSKENNFFWHNGNIPWITPSDITYERDISNSMVKLTEEGLLNGRYLPKNSILVTCIASIGKNAVLKVNGSCNQQINAIPVMVSLLRAYHHLLFCSKSHLKYFSCSSTKCSQEYSFRITSMLLSVHVFLFFSTRVSISLKYSVTFSADG